MYLLYHQITKQWTNWYRIEISQRWWFGGCVFSRARLEEGKEIKFTKYKTCVLVGWVSRNVFILIQDTISHISYISCVNVQWVVFCQYVQTYMNRLVRLVSEMRHHKCTRVGKQIYKTQTGLFYVVFEYRLVQNPNVYI